MTRIVFDRVIKFYGGLAAVDALTLDLSSGSLTGLVGANGAGKSTSMRILLNLTRATQGSATFDGVPYARLRRPARVVGAMTEPDVFHPGRRGRDALGILAAAAGLPSRRVPEVLEQVGLTAAAEKRAGAYSAGMRQRLALAAALLGDPQTLILDEPANGLDPAGVHWLRGLIRRLAGEGRTVLVSSHQLAELAQAVDDVAVIDRGRLVTHQPVASLSPDGSPVWLEQAYFALTRKEGP